MKTTIRNFRLVALLAAGSLAALSSTQAQAPAAPAAPAAEATAAPVAPYAPKAPASITLKDAFKGRFVVGVAVRPDQVAGQNAQSAALIQREFNSVVAENAMKMGPIHPRPGNDDSSFEWAPADQIVAFGLKNKMFIIGHNLCWHSQMPGWMSQPEAGQETLTKAVLMQRLKDHIFRVVGRYKGKVNGWDVVNEAINDGQADYRQSIFYRVIGKEFLVWAFKWAHEADPGAELYYNDYNLDANDNKRATAIELVKYLRENGAVIHGIGMQGHYNLTTPSIAKIDETIGMFAALGLKVHITELDVTAIRGTSVSGAVGFNPNAPAPTPGTQGAANTTPPAQPQSGRGRGGRGGLPPIDTLKTDVKLTDAQVAAVAPILEKATQEITASMGSGDFARVAQIRTETLATLSKLVNENQKAALTTALTPPGRGGGRGPAGPTTPLTPELAQEQAKRYGEIFGAFLKHRNSIARVTFWGLRDTDSWRRQNHPLLFTDDYGRKPAYDAVIQAVASARIQK